MFKTSPQALSYREEMERQAKRRCLGEEASFDDDEDDTYMVSRFVVHTCIRYIKHIHYFIKYMV